YKSILTVFVVFFFFQAEDGIRDFHVTWSSDVCSSDLPPASTSLGAAIVQRRNIHIGDGIDTANFAKIFFQQPLNAQFHGEQANRSEEHTSELQSRENLVCRLLLEKKKK